MSDGKPVFQMTSSYLRAKPLILFGMLWGLSRLASLALGHKYRGLERNR
jgi:hypothetical protein